MEHVNWYLVGFHTSLARRKFNMLSFDELVFINKAKYVMVAQCISPIYIMEFFQVKAVIVKICNGFALRFKQQCLDI